MTFRPAALALAMLFPPFAAAQDGQRDFRDWSTVRGEAGCVAIISVGLREADSGLLTIALLPQHDEEFPAIMTARVPLGAMLNQPLTYTHPRGEEAIGLTWQSCNERTCLASTPLGVEEIERLKRGTRIFYGFQPLPGVRPLIVPISLLGVTRAWNEAQACG
jgi:invasion protein IalB